MLVGPTAVGKTETSIALCQRLKGEIISADSMQLYRHMNIGTAKPSLEEQQGIPHHLIDIIEPDASFTVADFQSEAARLIDAITKRNKFPIVAGGTGLYINSLLYDMDFTSAVSNWNLRQKLQKDAQLYGNEYVYKKLQDIDPNAATKIHPNNVKRVIRALEVNYESGENFGDFKNDIEKNTCYEPLLIGLTRDRSELYERINYRVDQMIETGLIEEVKNLLDCGYTPELIAFKGLGYKEIIAYLEGQYDLEEAITILKRDTRRYAKRQLTWFNRYQEIQWYNLTDQSSSNIIEAILKNVEGYFNLS